MCGQVHEAGDDAEWRHQRLTTQEFIRRLKETGRRVSPIFSVFGVEIYLFRIDWLHAVDQGVGADFAGNAFEELLPRLAGNTKEQRCSTLNDKLQSHYERRGVQDRIKTLGPLSFARPSANQPAKLKGSAAQVRNVIPFVQEFCDEVCRDDMPREAAIKSAAKHLSHCYQALASSSAPVRDEALYTSSQAHVLQCHALYEGGDGVCFRCKPKHHAFLELCSQKGVVPNSFWCYRDEDFGGPIARIAKPQGMWKRMKFYTRRALDMFTMKNPVPKIVSETPRED